MENSVIIIIFASLFGFNIPFLSRYFIKAYPCTMSSFLYGIPKYIKRKKPRLIKSDREVHKQLKIKFWFAAAMWGILFLLLPIILFKFKEISVTQNIAMLIWLWLFALASDIDFKYGLIPDIITFPLILLGILIVSLEPNNYSLINKLALSPLEGAVGGLYGYFISVLASLMLIKKYPDGFGGGDIKLLAAVGVVSGIDRLSEIIIYSLVLFGLAALIKKQKAFPYAPFLFVAYLIFLLY